MSVQKGCWFDNQQEVDKKLSIINDAATTITTTTVNCTTVGATTVNTSILNTGNIVASGLPTSDPSNAGQLWNDSGTVKVSAG
jgi:hypothetical protein